MNEGMVSARLGLKGIPSEAEEIMAIRDILLARRTGGHVHLAHMSTKGSVELIRWGKERGINVTAEVCPHHLSLTEDAVAKIKREANLDELVLLPLYPHYSYATTLSSLKEWRRVYGEPEDSLPERTVEHFFDHPLYIQSLVTNIGKILRQFPDSSRIHLVFSAHGLPMSLVEKGDPYPEHVKETVRLVCEQGATRFANWPKTHLLCFQSKVGPAKWLEPSFVGTLEKLGHEGVKEMLVVPISFVTEHIETLHEINIEGRADAKKAGIERFRMMPAVGDSPAFIGASRISFSAPSKSTRICPGKRPLPDLTWHKAGSGHAPRTTACRFEVMA